MESVEERMSIPTREADGARLEEALPDGLTEIRHPDGIYQWLSREQLARRHQQPPREPAPRHQKHWELAAALGTLLLVFVIASVFVRSRVREAASLNAPERLETSAAEVQPMVAAPGDASPRRQDELRATVETEIEGTVSSWADAWSGQDIDRYLTFYSDRFVLPDGMSRSSWESFRRMRITRSAATVTLDDLETSVQGPGSAVARLVETFQTPYSVHRVAKSLELVKESGRWKILVERSVPL